MEGDEKDINNEILTEEQIRDLMNDTIKEKLKEYTYRTELSEKDKGKILKYIKKKNNMYCTGGFIHSYDTGVIRIIGYYKGTTWYIYEDDNYLFVRDANVKGLRNALQGILKGSFTVS